VAVADGDADVALGTDTGGSVRIPSACCGTVGLKTTWGRIPLGGVWPLAPSLDTVGPMARDVAGVVAGMQLLEPGFRPTALDAGVGRVRLRSTDPVVDAAIDAALAASELPVADVTLPGWVAGGDATLTVILAEAYAADRELLAESEGVGEGVRELLALGAAVEDSEVRRARTTLAAWRDELTRAVVRAGGVLALPTLLGPPPALERLDRHGRLVLATAPINGAGLPSLALPAARPAPGRPWPPSVQLVGAPGTEELLVAVGARLEAAVAG
jgi:amidase